MKDRILERLLTGEWLSTVQMTLDMHIFGGGQRIHDLRKSGYDIEERRVEGKTFSEYRLRPPRPITLPPAFKPAPVAPPENKEQKLFA